jgi:hypothetical protein
LAAGHTHPVREDRKIDVPLLELIGMLEKSRRTG